MYRILKECSVELAPVFCKLFNLCLEKETLPDIWKLSAISPLPKTANPKCSNDFRPIALTSVVMKIFEQIIKSRLLSHIVLDEHQFAYRKNRSTKDACIALDHVLRSHLEKANSYARVLFVDFSSAFNTIVPNFLIDKLISSNVPKYIVSFVKAFLCDRRQFVRVGGAKSNILNCDIGCPQGCVLSPVLFSI